MPKNNPLVSICIPAYNNEDYISETLDSILAQTYTNLEIIIVDDCSKDGTVRVLEEYAAKDSRISIYRNEKNLGMSGNWNRALSLTKGEFIRLMCADDLLVPTCIEREIEAFEANPTAVLVESDSRLVDLERNPKGFYKRYRKTGLVPGKEILKAGLFNKDYFGAPQANLMRRSAFEKTNGIDSDFTYIVDYVFFAEMAVQGDIFIIHEFLNEFRVRHESNTGQVMKAGSAKNKIYVEEHRRLLEKNKDILGLNKFEIGLSMLIRRLRCFAAGMYLLIFVRG